LRDESKWRRAEMASRWQGQDVSTAFTRAGVCGARILPLREQRPRETIRGWPRSEVCVVGISFQAALPAGV
jgi:hypothetical protein